ncbi:MAG: hypothetical protein IIY16_05420 [Oscillospiraceae bacterium]|nr:hypothetical protein [Oscillospiraceae bacterium]
MITIWNRRELLTTQSMEKQADVRRILSRHGIDYRIKTVSRGSTSVFSAPDRARSGSIGSEYACTYIFYVRKADYALAATCLQNRSF